MKNNIASDTNNSVVFEDDQQASLETKKEFHSNQKDIPIVNHQNIPIEILGQCGQGHHSGKWKKPRRYTKAERIQTLADNKYRANGEGITIEDVTSARLALHKEQAQTTLKYYLKRGILFTLRRRNPQIYYPVCQKSEIIKKNIQKEVTGVNCSKPILFPNSQSNNNPELILQDNILDSLAIRTLEDNVLPLLPKAPLYIHKIQFKLRVDPEYYHQLNTSANKSNKGKVYEDIIGRSRVLYIFYPNGVVVVSTENSNNPYTLANETDRSCLLAFFGQIRDRLIITLSDKHERIVPSILEWQLTQCDINKDIKDSDWVQVTQQNTQVKHFDHLFRVYIKSMGRDTVCRIEESCNPVNKSPVEAINDILNPCEKLEKHIAEVEKKLTDIFNRLEECAIRINSDYNGGGVNNAQKKA